MSASAFFFPGHMLTAVRGGRMGAVTHAKGGA